MSAKIFLLMFLATCLSVTLAESDEDLPDKEEEIDCVNSCGETVDEWKACAQNCYGDFMDDSDRTFLACETDCVERLYRPNVDESQLGDLEICAEGCIEAYRGEVLASN